MEEAIRVLICGDRNWRDAGAIFDTLDVLQAQYQDNLIVIQGEARGADTIAWVSAAILGIECESFPADWEQYGRRAGPIRNQQMLDSGVELCIGFHPDIEQSRGTKDMLTRAARAGVPTFWNNGMEEVPYEGTVRGAV